MSSRRITLILSVLMVVTFAVIVEVSGSDKRNGRIERVEYQRSTMVHVKAGTFIRGPTEDQKEELIRSCVEEAPVASEWLCVYETLGLDKIEADSIYLDAFEIDRYETTVAEFRTCVTEGGCELTALIAGDERYLVDDWPMVNVTWQDAVDHCEHQGKRLPTEAEWEKAARGTKGALWPWGNQNRDDGSNHGKSDDEEVLETLRFLNIRNGGPGYVEAFIPDDSDGFEFAHEPGALRWSEGAYGAYDMAGNVSEWVADYWSREGYAELPTSNPLRDVPHTAGDDDRAFRGGSWRDPQFFGATFLRFRLPEDARDTDIGFRCARSIE